MTSAVYSGGDPNELASKILTHFTWPFTIVCKGFLRDEHKFGLSLDRPICAAYTSGHCPNGTGCLDRHIAGSTTTSGWSFGGAQGPNSLVCKHWLRGLCKKGDQCEFLHEYNLRKMPECNFFARNGYCSNGEECLYLHVNPQSRLPECPDYNRGFCPLGLNCSKKHVRREMCEYYRVGFCPDGPTCKGKAHPKWGKGKVGEHGNQTTKADQAEDDEDFKGRILAGEVDDLGDRDKDGGRGGRDRDDSRARQGRGRWRNKGDRRFRGRPGGHQGLY